MLWPSYMPTAPILFSSGAKQQLVEKRRRESSATAGRRIIHGIIICFRCDEIAG